MSNNQLVNWNSLDNQANLYKKAQSDIKENAEVIQKAIDKNTEKEVENVKKAIETLNNKVEKIMESEFVKTRQQNIEKSGKQMAHAIKEASNTFFKVREVIRSKENLSQEEKNKYEHQLYERIIDKFMTKEERDMFERLIRSGPMIMLGGRSGGMKMLGM
tara:strand:- start:219 stop:698 length:480 start_codon:yes stop_codon:yes gene_type:complete